MATPRGAWALRASVVTAMVAGLVIAASPAQAQPGQEGRPDVRLESIGNVELRVGDGPQSVSIRVRNRAKDDDDRDNTARDVRLTMTVPLTNEGVGITSAGDCDTSAGGSRADCTIAEIPPEQERAIVVQIGVDPGSPIAAGDNRSGAAQVQLTSGGAGGAQSFNIRVNGPDRAPSIAQISGTVTDQTTGEPIDNAQVTLIDGGGNEHSRGTDNQGRFNFQPSDTDPIAPGRFGLIARKDGWEGVQYSHPTPVAADASAADVRLVMINQRPPTEAPESPEPSESPEARSSEDAESAVPVAEEAPSSSRGTFTTVMVILGGLLVALGIGAIVFLIIRRRREAEEEDGDDGGYDGSDDPTSGPRGPNPTPGSQGIYRPTPTQVAGQGAATQVIPRAGASGLPAVGPNPALAQTSLMPGGPGGAADATTVLPRAVDDSPTRIADVSAPPTRAPGSPPVPRRAAPQPPTYQGGPEPAGYAGGYDQPTRAGGYDHATQGSGAGDYGSRSGGRYDEPTGRFDRFEEPGAGYDRSYDPGGGYGPDPYAQPASPSSGYGGDHGAQGYAHPAQGYGSDSYGGYGAGSSYGSAGQESGYSGSGYGQPDQYADPSRGYEYDSYREPGEPHSRGSVPPERGRPEWRES